VISTENVQLPTLLTRFLPPELTGKKKLEKAVEFVEEFLRLKIGEHKATLGTSEDGFHRDFMDAYLQEIKDTRDRNSSFFGDVGGNANDARSEWPKSA